MTVLQNPLTPFWFVVTTFFEIGLGLATYLSFIYILPIMHEWGTEKKTVTKTFFTSSSPLVWLLAPRRYQKGPMSNKTVTGDTPAHLKKFILSKIPEGIGMIILLGVTLDLVFSKGWIDPLSWDGLEFDLVFARASGTPNGAHILTYLSIPALALVVVWKYHDVFLGLITGALFAAVHELIWIPAYYIAYWQYYTGADLTDVLKDISFSVMLVLFVLTFIKYKYQKMSLRMFAVPILLYCWFVDGWFLIPHLLDPSFYGYLPVTVLSNFNPVIGQTVYNLSPWYNDLLTGVLEITSWIMLQIGFVIVIVRRKK